MKSSQTIQTDTDLSIFLKLDGKMSTPDLNSGLVQISKIRKSGLVHISKIRKSGLVQICEIRNSGLVQICQNKQIWISPDLPK